MPRDHFTALKGHAAQAVKRFLDKRLIVPETSDAPLFEAMRYAVLGDGKAFRPLLCFAAGKLFDLDDTHLTPLGAAIEAVHAYSLIHDDLPCMDDDDLRRGKPSTHKQFGEATALLAGNALLSLAFHILADETFNIPAQTRLTLIRTLGEATGAHGMIGGQIRDMQLSAGHALTPHETIMQLHEKKTGALIKWAIMAPAYVANATAHQIEALAGFAYHLGIAFQIADDILDSEAQTSILGKTAGKDARQNKPSLVLHYGAENARAMLDTHINEALGTLALFSPKDEILRTATLFVKNRES